MEIFHTLAEVSVAITGFSSLIIIFRGSDAAWQDHDYVHFGFVLAWSIGSIFLSLIPLLLAEFGAAAAQAARLGLYATVLYIIVTGSVLTRIQTRTITRHGVTLPFLPRLLMTMLIVTTAVIALLAGISVLPGAPHAWLGLAIVLLLVAATADLGIFVVQTTRKGPA